MSVRAQSRTNRRLSAFEIAWAISNLYRSQGCFKVENTKYEIRSTKLKVKGKR